MILVFKQQPHFSPNPSYGMHRRLPSAPPAVVVQPTRTPGLLSLSKPPQRPQRPRASPKPKQASPVPAPAVAVAAVVDKKHLSSEKPRGRQPHSPKDKSKRSASHSSVRSRRNNTRQPSPPVPSQAEVSSTPRTSNNHFDPFMDETSSRPTFLPPAPTLSARPSGKLARRRQPNIIPFELPASGAIPVPKRSSPPSARISRSDPLLSHMPSRNPKGKTAMFPICDDMTESGLSDSEDISLPPTPTPVRARRFDDAPRTAPLTTSTVMFPFETSLPSPLARKGKRNHKRTPSEGVFNMSSDEDVNPTSDDLRALFGLQSRRRAETSISKLSQAELEREAVAAYFASSIFQNSPSPEELPPPAF